MGDAPYKNRDWLDGQVKSGASDTEIAGACGCSVSTIGRWRRKFGIPKAVRPDRFDRELLIELYIEESMSGPEIARLLGCSSSTIYHWMNYYSIERRTRDEVNDVLHENNRTFVICEWCGKKMEVPICYSQKRFCSRKCYGRWASASGSRRGENNGHWKGGEIEVDCEWCGARFTTPPARLDNERGRFCSLDCLYDFLSERLSLDGTHLWKGGASFESYPKEFNESFKRGIRKRDGSTCALCGLAHARDVHHIDYDKGNTKPENCITLCRSCHSKTNTRRDFWESKLSAIVATR